jgi:hypothetical protein
MFFKEFFRRRGSFTGYINNEEEVLVLYLEEEKKTITMG